MPERLQRSMSFSAGLGLSILLAASAFAQAPDYTQSTLTGPTEARERDPVSYVLTVRNTGDAASAYLGIRIVLPGNALRASAAPELSYEAEDRALRGNLSLAPGEERALAFTVIAAPESAGSILSPMAEVQAVPGGMVLHTSTDIVRRRAPGELIPLFGGYQMTRAGAWVLGYLALCPLFVAAMLLVAALRRRGRVPIQPLPVGRIVAAAAVVLGCLGFLAMFVGMGREDRRILTDFREAACEVLDVSGKAAASSSSRSGRSATWTPMLAVRFQVEGREQFGSGFDSATRLRMAGRAALQEELARFSIGTHYPCWYDPEDPARILVKRGPGGAYAFALLPAGMLWIGLRPLLKAIRNDRGPRREG
jgi:hypothetical protein